MIPLLLAVGGVIIILGALFLYFGKETPEDEKYIYTDMGFGPYYDRSSIEFRAILVLIIGVVVLIVGLFGNMP